MATRRTKNGDEEKLDFDTLEKVIALLEQEKPITKKEACSILNITYNTTRLASLIEKHKEKKKRDAERRASLRGKPVTKDEVVYIITSYLEGDTVDSICKATFRGTQIVHGVLEEYNVPVRARSHDYFNPKLLPEGCMRDRFEVGEIVYSSRYDCIASIEEEIKQKGQWIYRIWLKPEKWSQYAYQEACELGSLKHLIELGIKLT